MNDRDHDRGYGGGEKSSVFSLPCDAAPGQDLYDHGNVSACGRLHCHDGGDHDRYHVGGGRHHHDDDDRDLDCYGNRRRDSNWSGYG